MAWFGQGRDTIEWDEYRDDVLFYKWPANEIKKGAHLIIRPGQKAIFYADGVVGAVFEKQGNFDIMSEIVPFSSTLKGWLQLRGDTGMRAEVYFVNAKELTLPWGTRQRIMLPVPQVPAGIPVGCNGNMIISFRDYEKFIEKVAGVKETYSLEDVSERIMGELNPVVCEAILDGEQSLGINALVTLQQNARKIGKKVCEELDKELADFGLGVTDVNIQAFNYPKEVEEMAAKTAGQAFVGDVNKYTAVSMADSFGTPNSAGSTAASGMGLAMGMQMANQMMNNGAAAPGQQMQPQQAQPQQMQPQQAAAQAPGAAGAGVVCTGCGNMIMSGAKFCPNCGVAAPQPQAEAGGERFCPNCRKMVTGAFCPDCGTPTV